MPNKDKDVAEAVEAVKLKAADAGRTVADQAEAAKQALADAGRAVASTAADVKEQVVETATAARDRVGDAAVLAVDRTGDALTALDERLPHTAAEWEAAGRGLLDGIRRNPTPWLVGAGAVLVAYLLGRRASGSK